MAFRVIADHIRTLSFAIADGIQPGNTDRNYVLRRILRRAVRYGRTLGFHEPFFYKLVAVLADTMGDVFPEIRAKRRHIEEVIQREEEAFNKTLDRGISMFEGGTLTTSLTEKMVSTVAFEDAFRNAADSEPIRICGGLPEKHKSSSSISEEIFWPNLLSSFTTPTASRSISPN